MEDHSDLDLHEPWNSYFRRFANFLRSVVPQDPWQLVLIAGLICLSVAPPKMLWLHPVGPEEAATYTRLSENVPWVFSAYYVLVALLITIGASVGFAIGLWRIARPARLIFLGVCLPALFGLAAICVWHVYLENASVSVLIRPTFYAAVSTLHPSKIWRCGPGVHFCVSGILLVSAFAVRVKMGLSRLPVSLPGDTELEGDRNSVRSKLLLWVMIGPQLWVLTLLVSLPAAVLLSVDALARLGKLFVLFIACLESLLAFVVILWIVGPNGRNQIKKMLHLPAIGWLGIGIGIPLGIAALIPLAEFVYDRAHWAAFDFGRFGPPDPWFYLPHPAIWMVFDYFFAALVEEVVCRGVLQQSFIRRLGTSRGIFLVSMVWAAAHFHLDARAGLQATDLGELVTLVWRVLVCLALGYTLSWLTIRSASLWPAIIVHTLYNFLQGWGAVFDFRGRTYVEIGIWAVLAVVLFRFWPLRHGGNEKILPPVEPALGL